jgi:hypothetical protein
MQQFVKQHAPANPVSPPSDDSDENDSNTDEAKKEDKEQTGMKNPDQGHDDKYGISDGSSLGFNSQGRSGSNIKYGDDISDGSPLGINGQERSGSNTKFASKGGSAEKSIKSKSGRKDERHKKSGKILISNYLDWLL